MAPSTPLRRNKHHIHSRLNENCKFIRCATQLADGGSLDCVRVKRCFQEQRDTNAASTPNQDSSGEQWSDDDKCGESERAKDSQLSAETMYKTNSQTVIITTTSFGSIPTLRKQNAIYIKPLIVLDLNGILCHRVREKTQSTAPNNTTYRTSIGRIANTDIIPRSDLASFLQLLNAHFAVAVWTSATSKTAKGLVKMLFPEEMRRGLVFVWHRSFCNLVKTSEIDDDGRRKKKRRKRNRACEDSAEDDTTASVKGVSADPTSGNHHQDIVAIKSLSKVWSMYPLWNQSNTLLLDDSPDKCPRKHRGNAIHPPCLCGTKTMLCGANTTSDAAVDDDQGNQTLQHQFFQLLAQHWSTPQIRRINESVDGNVCHPGKSLNEFLEEHAASYNFTWEGST